MGNLTELNGLIALDDLVPDGGGTRGDGPLVAVRDRQPRDRATREQPAIDAKEIESWTRHARAANGLGDVATRAAAASAGPTPADMRRAARVDRAFNLAEIIAELVWTVGKTARQAYARYAQRRQASAVSDALGQLDDRTLRDLGFDRSEMRSVAAEFAGEAETTRLRVLLSHYPRW